MIYCKMKNKVVFTDEEQREMLLERHKKCASFFFTLAQLVFTAFIIGSLAVFFTDFTFSWRVLAMFFFGVAFMFVLYKIGFMSYNLNTKKEEEDV